VLGNILCTRGVKGCVAGRKLFPEHQAPAHMHVMQGTR
jgi:hypothetical protein